MTFYFGLANDQTHWLFIPNPMKKVKRNDAKTESEDGDSDAYTAYQNKRYDAYILRRNSLNDLAFKTSERYDQWVLTLSGGALALSLTFLEKIAPDAGSTSVWALALSWFAYILAVLCGFWAIFVSRQAIYREIEIGEAVYANFVKTGAEDNPVGEPLVPEPENQYTKRLECLNRFSCGCLVAGTILMCLFAITHISGGKSKKGITITAPGEISVHVQSLPEPSTNAVLPATATTTNVAGNTNGANTVIASTGTKAADEHLGGPAPQVGAHVPPPASLGTNALTNNPNAHTNANQRH